MDGTPETNKPVLRPGSWSVSEQDPSLTVILLTSQHESSHCSSEESPTPATCHVIQRVTFKPYKGVHETGHGCESEQKSCRVQRQELTIMAILHKKSSMPEMETQQPLHHFA